MARELVIHVLLLLYCHQVHFTQNLGDHVCSGPLLCLLIPPLIGGALFCIWSCKFNVYEQKWVTCRHSLCGNKENIFILIFFFLIFINNNAYMHEFHSSKMKEKVYTYSILHYTHIRQDLFDNLRKYFLQFTFFDYVRIKLPY